MLAERIVALARRTASTQLGDRDRPLEMSVRSCRIRLRGRGELHLQIVELYEREVAARAQVIWSNLHRAHGSLSSQVSESLRADLAGAFRVELDSTVEQLRSQLEADMRDAPRGVMPNWAEELTAAGQRELRRYEAEIEHYVASLEAARARGTPAAAAYFFQGSVGAVLTGQGAVANVVQNINPDQREALLKALEVVNQAIRAAPELDDRARGELVEIAEEAASEVGKESPNTRRLSLTLTTLAAAVQGIASAPGAYEVLRAAAGAIGITF